MYINQTSIKKKQQKNRHTQNIIPFSSGLHYFWWGISKIPITVFLYVVVLFFFFLLMFSDYLWFSTKFIRPTCPFISVILGEIILHCLFKNVLPILMCFSSWHSYYISILFCLTIANYLEHVSLNHYLCLLFR